MCFNDPSSCASSYCTNSYCANPPNDKQSNAAPALNLTSDPGAAALVAQAQLAAAQVSGDGTGGTPPKPPSIDYKNQLNYSDVKVAGGGTLADSGCGVIAGAMVFSLVTGKSDPAAYMALLDKHGGVTSGGTGWFDQIKPIFDENHFTVVPVYGSTADKEKQITQYAKNGTPVWINAYIDNGSGAWIGHHTLAIGVDSSTGDLILDDPYYGKDYHMPISRFDIDCSHSGCPNGTSSWIMNAIIPPPPSPTS